MRFSQIPIALSDVGVLENHDIVVCLNRGERIVASYDGEAYNITCNDLDGRANGILFTSLGRSLAKLYDQTFNDFGRKLFKDWITDLPPSRYSVSKI